MERGAGLVLLSAPPSVLALPFDYRRDASAGKIERQAPGAIEHATVGLEPARSARAWQVPVSDHNIGTFTSRCERALFNQIAIAS